MKKFLQVLLHVLGFPLLMAAIVLVSIPLIKCGISYGVFIFVGIIVTAVMAIIYYITFICMVKSKKKSITRQTISLIIVVFVCLCGFWCVFDLAVPDLLAGATSQTIFYEDLVDNYEARALVNKGLLDEYIRRNYNIGNLPKTEIPPEVQKQGGAKLADLQAVQAKEIAQYQKEGFKNKYVKMLLQYQFASIDKDGYTTFVEPWIGMANGGRLTIPTLIHLLTDDRGEKLKKCPYVEFDAELKELKETDPLQWNVLDMLGTDMAIDLDIGAILPDNYKFLARFIPGILEGVQGDVANVVESLLGSPIYVSYNGTQIVLTPSNESRGVLDYQSMAWLNSNGLVYAIVALLATRNLFLIFAGWLVLSNFLIGVLRGMGKENRARAGKVDVDYSDVQDTDSNQPVNNFMPMPYPYGYVVNSVGYNITPNHGPMNPAFGMNMNVRPMQGNGMVGQQRGAMQQRPQQGGARQRPQGGQWQQPNNNGRGGQPRR